MRLLRLALLVSSALGMTSAAFAQTPVPAAPGQNPPAPAPSVSLFPADARFGFIDFQRVASTSATGKIAQRILKEFSDKKVAELTAQDQQLQAVAAKRDPSMAPGPASAQITREVAKRQRELEFARASAQAEFQQMQTDLEADLQAKVTPVVAAIAQERNLLAVFGTDSSLLYLLPAVDISDEVVKRLDAQTRTKGGR
jgi:outer membrane protein